MNNPIHVLQLCIILQAVTIKSFSKLLKKPIKSNTPGVWYLKENYSIDCSSIGFLYYEHKHSSQTNFISKAE